MKNEEFGTKNYGCFVQKEMKWRVLQHEQGCPEMSGSPACYLLEPGGEVVDERPLAKRCLQLPERTQVQGRGAGFAHPEHCSYLRQVEALAVQSVEVTHHLLFRPGEALQGFVDALPLPCAEHIVVVLSHLCPLFLQLLSGVVALDAEHHHLFAPVAGVSGKAAAHTLVVASRGFAQTEAPILSQVLQAYAEILHSPSHRVCHWHVADDEQTAGICELCHLDFLNILSHFSR